MPEAGLQRILMTADTVGGVWTFALELCEALAPHGIEVLLATMGGEPTVHQLELARRVPNLRLATSNFKLEWMDDPWNDLDGARRWLLDLEAEFEPHLVHVNSYGHGGIAWSTPVLLTAHSCVISWWQAVKGSAAPREWSRYRQEVELALEAADLRVAPSRALARSMGQIYGAACEWVPNGRKSDGFRVREKQPLVLTVGRLWDEAKNVAAVARAAERLLWPVYAAGDDRHPDGRQEQFPGCRMLGRLSAGELAEWYGRAAIFAEPARYEPFGLSVLEAALSGCALVLGDIPSLREIWHDAAEFVSPGDDGAIEAALQELIRDPAARQSLASAAVERAHQYTPERMASGYLDAYRRTAGGRFACAS